MLLQMVFNLCLTVIVEILAAMILGITIKQDLIYIMLINCVTNPIVNYSMNAAAILFNPKIQVLNVLLVFLEASAVISEGIFYKKYLISKRIKPMILSLILNGASYLSGVGVFMVSKSF